MKLIKYSTMTLACAAAFAFTVPVHADRPDKPDRRGGFAHAERSLEKLPEDLRERAKAAFEKAKDDPAVVEARKKAEEANKAVRDAYKEAVRKADAGVADALDKLHQGKKDKDAKE